MLGDSDFTIELHHVGRFHDLGNFLEYLGGDVVVCIFRLHFELDEWSVQEIVSELRKLGYKGYAKIWCCAPGYQINSGLRVLMSDGDAMKMGRLLVSQSIRHCSIYVVDGCREGNEVEITSTEEDYVPSREDYNDTDEGLLEVEVEGEPEPSNEDDKFDDSVDDCDHDDHFGFEVEDEGNGGATSNAFSGFIGPLNENVNGQGGGDEDGVDDAGEKAGVGGDDVHDAADEDVDSEISEGYETEEIGSYEGNSNDMIKKKRYPKYNTAEMHKNYEFQGEDMKLGTVIQCIQDKYMANISVTKAYWARRKEREEVHGRAISQYGWQTHRLLH
ncbi:hypothetical protein PIB30_087408 [Stylosanthes scabra]|uniref:PB1-like domain-containing protein n=1 Tax=Stylosanthes scabra TaxID=79078 RepID=A0ABU6TT19_9FABA|nr:hypothetical protein [Stylosanthes scabra]